jgi:polar amino acid transport system substrate-binding protein
MYPTIPRRSGALVLLVAGAVALGACGGGGKKKSSTTPTTTAPTAAATSSKVAAEVPAALKSKGTLKVAADATYAPDEFIKGGKVVGMDADLAKALATVMGLKANVGNVTFDAIIPGLAAKKYDLGMSSFTDTKEREKTVDFVTYFSAGTSFYVKASGGPTINGLADICGRKVAVEKGTTEQDDATAQSKKCTAAGKPAAKLSVFPDQNGANLAVSSGRAEVGMADSPVAAYIVKQSGGQFKLTGQPYGTAPYGIAMPKSNGMAKPVLDALEVLMANGTYRKILQTWGIQDGAINNPTINGATS